MSPACFIIPHRWVELEAMLKSCLDPQQHSLIARFERLRQRNRRLIEVGRLHKGDSGKSQREQLIRKLDCLRAPFDVPKVSEACLEMAQNHDTAIAILLQWISTPYREDEAYVYLTVRLLRKWNKLGYDTDKPILNYLATSRNSSGLRKHNLYQVVVEMIRSGQFSVGKYCQWLLARGVLTGHGGLHKVSVSFLEYQVREA
jgi:mediator of RNA polymerase II transcription subunit 12